MTWQTTREKWPKILSVWWDETARFCNVDFFLDTNRWRCFAWIHLTSHHAAVVMASEFFYSTKFNCATNPSLITSSVSGQLCVYVCVVYNWPQNIKWQYLLAEIRHLFHHFLEPSLLFCHLSLSLNQNEKMHIWQNHESKHDAPFSVVKLSRWGFPWEMRGLSNLCLYLIKAKTSAVFPATDKRGCFVFCFFVIHQKSDSQQWRP